MFQFAMVVYLLIQNVVLVSIEFLISMQLFAVDQLFAL